MNLSSAMGDLLQFDGKFDAHVQLGPATLLRIRRSTRNRIWPLLQETTPDLSLLSNLVSHDPGLAAHILRLANRERGTVYSIDEALVLLGSTALCQLMWSLPTVSCCDEDRIEQIGAHSRLTAIVSERFAIAYDVRNPQRAYIAGLLHDIGELALLSGMSSQEHSHTNVGSALLQSWRLPEFLADVAANHHRPRAAQGDASLVRVVAVADQIAAALGCGDQCVNSVDIGILVSDLAQLRSPNGRDQESALAPACACSATQAHSQFGQAGATL